MKALLVLGPLAGYTSLQYPGVARVLVAGYPRGGYVRAGWNDVHGHPVYGWVEDLSSLGVPTEGVPTEKSISEKPLETGHSEGAQKGCPIFSPVGTLKPLQNAGFQGVPTDRGRRIEDTPPSDGHLRNPGRGHRVKSMSRETFDDLAGGRWERVDDGPWRELEREPGNREREKETLGERAERLMGAKLPMPRNQEEADAYRRVLTAGTMLERRRMEYEALRGRTSQIPGSQEASREPGEGDGYAAF